jgi:hypothetical protein
MEADKNFFKEKPTRSQNHHYGFPRELAKACSHNGPTNPRNKSQLKPKRKHNSRSKGLRLFEKLLADCLQDPG